MKEFAGRVAVVTGAGGGIGRGLARRCAQEGMKVVLAGIKESTLLPVQRELEALGAATLVVKTDVSKAEHVENLAQRTVDEFGGVHLLFNNAGVTNMKPMWENTLADWEWVMGVNLWGTIHGIKYFVPIMLEQDTECHVVNNSSFLGLRSAYALNSIYIMTKQAIVALSETLYYELAHQNAKINVSVLCSGVVATDIMTSARNRPPGLQNDPQDEYTRPEIEAMQASRALAFAKAMPVDEFADIAFAAIRDNKFYVITHPDVMPGIKRRFDDILAGRNPTL